MSRRKSSDAVRVGIIGAGSVLWAYLQQLDRLIPRGLAALGPVCARGAASQARLRERRPGVIVVSDARQVIDSDADIVLVITSAESHEALTRAALEASKHVLCEKPMALTAEAGKGLVELAEQKRRVLMAAPFVHLSPTYRALWSVVTGGAIGRVHTGRGLYGTAAPDWNAWMFDAGPLADLGIYNLKSLTGILGPAVEVTAAAAGGDGERMVSGRAVRTTRPDVVHVIVRHASGALSSVVASWDIHAYRRPGIELYGTEGSAVLLGDDWDPRGFEIFRNDEGSWRSTDSLDPTWLWTDGLRELVCAVHDGRPPRADLAQDIHLLEILAATDRAVAERRPVTLGSTFGPLDLALATGELPTGHVHDHTRSPSEQR